MNAGNQAALRDDWLTVGTRRLSRGLAGLALVAAALFVSAPPAGAHSLGGAVPTNYRTRITSIVPELPGVEMRVVEAGSRLELTNRSSEDVVVTGYAEEAYLRIGPKGVFENRRSPATYLNRSRLPTSDIPARADPEAPPDWRRVSSARTVRWHDHRAHWMGDQDPPSVRRDPGRVQVVFPVWEVPLRVGETEVLVQGDLTWVPGPSPVPWLVLAAGAALAVALLGVQSAAVLAAALVALVGIDGARLLAVAAESDASPLRALTSNPQALAAWMLAAGAGWQLARRGSRAAAPLVAAAGALFALGGLLDLSVVSRSQLPIAGPEWFPRLSVAAGIGVGLGLTAAAVLRLRGSPETGAEAEAEPFAVEA